MAVDKKMMTQISRSCSSKFAHASLLFLGVGVLLYASLILRKLDLTLPVYYETAAAIESKHAASAPANLTLLPSDLPGYTGWARPSFTLATAFRIEKYSDAVASGVPTTVTVSCEHELCINGGALFYSRAYGRSLTSGFIQDYKNGTYDVTLTLFDAGIHTLEVVLAFSSPLSFESFPMKEEPGYEGYMLPGFPIQLTVTESSSPTRLCRFDELIETSPTSALDAGRWLVTQKVSDRPLQNEHWETKLNSYAQGFESYAHGLGSIGFQMDYFPTKCNLATDAQLRDPALFEGARRTLSNSKPVRHSDGRFQLHVAAKILYLFWKRRASQIHQYAAWSAFQAGQHSSHTQ